MKVKLFDQTKKTDLSMQEGHENWRRKNVLEKHNSETNENLNKYKNSKMS